MTRLDKNGKRYVIFLYLHGIIQGMLFFLGAWDFSLIIGWVYLGIELLNAIVTNRIVVRKNPEVMNERGRSHEGEKSWDKVLVKLYVLFAVRISIVMAGLDLGRFHWSQMEWY